MRRTRASSLAGEWPQRRRKTGAFMLWTIAQRADKSRRTPTPRRGHKENVADGRRCGDERADEQLVQRAQLKHRPAEDEGRAERGGHRCRMHALEEGLQPHEAQASAEGDNRTAQYEQGSRLAHSITSPRKRNLASAAVVTKPSSPMTSAPSKKSEVELRMPNVT